MAYDKKENIFVAGESTPNQTNRCEFCNFEIGHSNKCKLHLGYIFTHTQQKGWRKKFDNEFHWIESPDFLNLSDAQEEKLKFFISSLLTEQKKAFVEMVEEITDSYPDSVSEFHRNLRDVLTKLKDMTSTLSATRNI